ncbi:hypothetical protein A0257_16330 [Hymenobacter psoromatis]|nr:hypothetical protein A0257_16330 [Hymenobacter psoromatis]
MKLGFRVPRGSSSAPFLWAALVFFPAYLPLPGHGQTATKKTPAIPPKSAAVAHPGKPVIGTYYNYILDVDPNPYAYTVRVNGWLLSSSPGEANTHFSSTRLGWYLVQGQNTVTIDIGPPPKGVPPGYQFAVRVRTAAGTVAAYHWDPAKPHASLPVRANAQFEVPRLPLGPWAWQTAPRITLDAPTKAAINAHIKRLFNALDTKNVEAAVALFAPRNREDSAIDGTSAAESDAASRADWLRMFAVPGWHLDLIDYSKLHYTLEADGRAVLVLRANGSDVLRTTSSLDGAGGSYDLYFSLIHGQWTLIR